MEFRSGQDVQQIFSASVAQTGLLKKSILQHLSIPVRFLHNLNKVGAVFRMIYNAYLFLLGTERFAKFTISIIERYGVIGNTPLFQFVKITVFIIEGTNYFLRKKELKMLNRIKQIVIEIRMWIVRSNILDNIGKGMVYGNMVNSVGGGVNIRGAL